MSNFDRRYELVFGQSGAQGRSITDLHIDFSIEKTLDSTPNNCNITVYNLSDESIAELRKENTIITLSAGYAAGVYGRIFTGKVVTVESYRDGGTVTTSIAAMDGVNLKEAVTATRFPKNASLTEIFKKVAKDDLGLDIGEVRLNEFEKTYPTGYLAIGKSKRILDELAAQNHLSWVIDNETLVVIPRNSHSLEATFVLNEQTGLIGTPKLLSGQTTTLDSENGTEGLTATSLLNPYFTVNKTVIVQSRFHNVGAPKKLKITKAIHRGSFQGGDWVTELELLGHSDKEATNE